MLKICAAAVLVMRTKSLGVSRPAVKQQPACSTQQQQQPACSSSRTSASSVCSMAEASPTQGKKLSQA
jgi:hypothetical protein